MPKILSTKTKTKRPESPEPGEDSGSETGSSREDESSDSPGGPFGYFPRPAKMSKLELKERPKFASFSSKNLKESSVGSRGRGQGRDREPSPAGDDKTWVIDKMKKVTVREFKGVVYVDIREFYETKGGDLKPGKKGISLSAVQWHKFKELIPSVDAALKKF